MNEIEPLWINWIFDYVSGPLQPVHCRVVDESSVVGELPISQP